MDFLRNLFSASGTNTNTRPEPSEPSLPDVGETFPSASQELAWSGSRVRKWIDEQVEEAEKKARGVWSRGQNLSEQIRHGSGRMSDCTGYDESEINEIVKTYEGQTSDRQTGYREGQTGERSDREGQTGDRSDREGQTGDRTDREGQTGDRPDGTDRHGRTSYREAQTSNRDYQTSGRVSREELNKSSRSCVAEPNKVDSFGLDAPRVLKNNLQSRNRSLSQNRVAQENNNSEQGTVTQDIDEIIRQSIHRRRRDQPILHKQIETPRSKLKVRLPNSSTPQSRDIMLIFKYHYLQYRVMVVRYDFMMKIMILMSVIYQIFLKILMLTWTNQLIGQFTIQRDRVMNQAGKEIAVFTQQP